MNIPDMEMEFKKYVETFDISDEMIKRKYSHSYRVMGLSKLIASKSNFNKEDIELATIAGLLHDYARFEQWTKYRTYDDSRSVDHGDLAVKILFPGEIKKYIFEQEYYDEIYDAIKYHNKYLVPENLSQHNKILCNVVRDADKIDIFYLCGIDKRLVLDDNTSVTYKVEQDFISCKSINAEDAKTKADFVLLKLAMVFDLNFKFSYSYIKENKLIEKFYEQIENKQQFYRYFEIVKKYIDNKIEITS